MYVFSLIGAGVRRSPAILAVAAALLSALAARADDDKLNPKTYKSPDGRSTLLVDPSSPEGEGPATYRFIRDAKVLWSGEHDYTLYEAAVFESGVVGGYAYNHGQDGRARAKDSQSLLEFLILDHTGMVRLREGRARRHPSVMSNPPSAYVPVALGMIADGPNDWFAVRIQEEWNADDEKWVAFDAKAAKNLGEFTPDQPKHAQHGFHRAITCAVVPGTPLVLVHWYLWDTDDDVHTDSARLSLLDHSGKELWSFDLPKEYAGLGERWSWHWDLVRPGIVQSGMSERSFWFHSYKLAERIDYSVAPDASAPGGWKVSEVSRKAAGKPQPPAAAPVEDIERAPLGTIKLQTQTPGSVESPLHDLRSFAIAGDGTMAAVRWAQPPVLVLVRPDGSLIGEHPMAVVAPKETPDVVAISGARWLIHTSGLGGGKPMAWTFDAANPAAGFTRLDAINTGALKCVSAAPDGGFVAITGPKWPGASDITMFDAAGQQRWSVRAFSPEDVLALPDGRVAVLGNIDNKITYLKPDGSLERSVDLEACLKRRPNYVTELALDRDGGIVLYDFSGSPSVYRISAKDQVLERALPTYPNGRLAAVQGRVLASPVDARLWVCTHDALLRLGPDGKADLALGSGSGTGATLRHINALDIHSDGSLYAVNGDNAAVHVFNKDGSLRRVLKPEPTDFDGRPGLGSIAVLGDGSVVYSPGDQFRGSGQGEFVRFDPDGKRVGRNRAVLQSVCEDWYAVPGTQRLWAVGYESIGLIGEDGKLARTITRRPGDEWIGTSHDAGVAPDGSIAVVCGPNEMGTRGPAVACVYTNTGEPVKTVPLPTDTTMMRIAFNGRTIAISWENDVYLIPLEGGPTRRFKLAGDDSGQAWWWIIPSPDGTELWARRAETTELVRYPFDP